MRLVLLTVAAWSLALVNAAAQEELSTPPNTNIQNPVGLSKSPAAHEDFICHKDHEGLDLAAAESVVEASSRLDSASRVGGELIVVDIENIGCAYCASAIERAFSARSEIAAAYLNTRAGTLSIVAMADQEIGDRTIRRIVKRRGYGVTNIHRTEIPLSSQNATDESKDDATPKQ